MTKDVGHYVNFVIENDIPQAISKDEIIVICVCNPTTLVHPVTGLSLRAVTRNTCYG